MKTLKLNLETKKRKENAQIIINQGGNCCYVDCDHCPFDLQCNYNESERKKILEDAGFLAINKVQ